MKNKTDLDSVKNMAKYLLSLPIEHYKESNYILNHYFIRHVIYRDEQGQFREITTKQDEDYVRKFYIEIFDKIEDYFTFLVLVSPPYLSSFFQLTNSYLNSKDYTEALEFIWTEAEALNKDSNVSKKDWIRYFKRADKNLLMSKEELEVYNNLPNEIVIYRGTNSHSSYKALSWTLDYEKAKWFSTRFGKGKLEKVYKGTIDKKYILAYFNGRKESEVVVDYTKINDVEEIN